MSWWRSHEDELLRNMAKAGRSGSAIGLALGRSRYSVISRSRKLAVTLKGKPTGRPVDKIPAVPRQKRQIMVPQAPRRIAKAQPIIAPEPSCQQIASSPHIAGVPMMMLGAHQCRFAVNDASFGELHLFCGSPTEKQWCEHHRSVVYYRPVSLQHRPAR